MLGWFSNVLRMKWAESESISFRKQWYFLGMLSSEIVLEKKTWKKLLNSVSFEIFLPFSMRSFFSPFKDHFVERGIIVFQNVLLFVTFYILITVVDFFVVISTFLQRFLWSLKFLWLVSALSCKKFVLSLDLFISALWSSLIIKGAFLAQTYFF